MLANYVFFILENTPLPLILKMFIGLGFGYLSRASQKFFFDIFTLTFVLASNFFLLFLGYVFKGICVS